MVGLKFPFAGSLVLHSGMMFQCYILHFDSLGSIMCFFCGETVCVGK